MGKVEDYREKLKQLDDWEPFLLDESDLPGRRANIELARAVAEEGQPAKTGPSMHSNRPSCSQEPHSPMPQRM